MKPLPFCDRKAMNGYWIDTLGLTRKTRRFQDLEKSFGPDIRFARLPEAILRYKDVGTGDQTLLITPDAPNTIEHYDRLCDLLENDFRIVILELPGFGFSLPTKKDFLFTLEEASQSVVSFLQKLRLKSAVVCFPCVAGFVALRVAHKRPDWVDSIVNVQTPSWQEQKKWAKRVDVKGMIATPVLGQLLVKSNKRRIARKWYHAALPHGADDGVFYAICRHALDQGAQFSLASAFQGFFRDSDFRHNERFAGRAVALWGDADRSHKETHKESSLEALENGELIHLPETGHFPELERPEWFARLLIERFKAQKK